MARKGIVVGEHTDDAVGVQHQRVEVGRGNRTVHNGKIEFKVLHRIIKIFYGIGCNCYRYAVIFPAKFREYFCNQVALRRVRDADAKAGEAAVGGFELLHHLLLEGFHAPDVLHDDFTFRRQLNLPFFPQKERHAELLLELLDVMADGGLGEAQGICRAGEAAELRRGEKRTEFWIEHGSALHS